MLYKFKSKAAADLIMLEPNGRQILTLIGKSDAVDLVKGILLPEAMPAATLALEQAVADEEAQRERQRQEASAQGETIAPSASVSLRQRATPFLAMLKRCHAAKEPIVWGV